MAFDQDREAVIARVAGQIAKDPTLVVTEEGAGTTNHCWKVAGETLSEDEWRTALSQGMKTLRENQRREAQVGLDARRAAEAGISLESLLPPSRSGPPRHTGGGPIGVSEYQNGLATVHPVPPLEPGWSGFVLRDVPSDWGTTTTDAGVITPAEDQPFANDQRTMDEVLRDTVLSLLAIRERLGKMAGWPVPDMALPEHVVQPGQKAAYAWALSINCRELAAILYAAVGGKLIAIGK